MFNAKCLLILTLLASVICFGCDDRTSQMMKPVLNDRPDAPADVLIYTGSTWWITQADATAEAEITKRLLQPEGIQVKITESEEAVREWMV